MLNAYDRHRMISYVDTPDRTHPIGDTGLPPEIRDGRSISASWWRR